MVEEKLSYSPTCAQKSSCVQSQSLHWIKFYFLLHAKTRSRDVVDTVHRLGYGISYTDTIFVQDKWAEWSTNRSSIIPKNIQKGVVTHVTDNIDFKNKSIQPGRETHNTNSILIHVDSNAKSI